MTPHTVLAGLALRFLVRGLSVTEGDSVFVHTRCGFFEEVSACGPLDRGIPMNPPASPGKIESS
jgi:hypothetical protein